MRITPFAARAPYMAAEASLRTEMEATSFELMYCQSELLGTPSTTTKGSLLPVVSNPRICTEGLFLPGSPVDCKAVVPGSRPCNELAKFTVGLLCKSAPCIEETDPVN